MPKRKRCTNDALIVAEDVIYYTLLPNVWGIVDVNTQWDQDERKSYYAIYEQYRQSESNPFLRPLERLCQWQQLSVPAKVKLLFHLDKVVRKHNIVYVDYLDTRKGSYMNELVDMHLNAFFKNKFPN